MLSVYQRSPNAARTVSCWLPQIKRGYQANLNVHRQSSVQFVSMQTWHFVGSSIASDANQPAISFCLVWIAVPWFGLLGERVIQVKMALIATDESSLDTARCEVLEVIGHLGQEAVRGQSGVRDSIKQSLGRFPRSPRTKDPWLHGVRVLLQVSCVSQTTRP